MKILFHFLSFIDFRFDLQEDLLICLIVLPNSVGSVDSDLLIFDYMSLLVIKDFIGLLTVFKLDVAVAGFIVGGDVDYFDRLDVAKFAKIFLNILGINAGG